MLNDIEVVDQPDTNYWTTTGFGKERGKSSFRQWQATFTLSSQGAHSLLVRCTNSNGMAQPGTPVWNPAGYLNAIGVICSAGAQWK